MRASRSRRPSPGRPAAHCTYSRATEGPMTIVDMQTRIYRCVQRVVDAVAEGGPDVSARGFSLFSLFPFPGQGYRPRSLESGLHSPDSTGLLEYLSYRIGHRYASG